jgi:hypothetical protein
VVHPYGCLIPVENLITSEIRYYKREHLEKFDVLRVQLEQSSDEILKIYEDHDTFHSMIMSLHYKTPLDPNSQHMAWIKDMLTRLSYSAEIEIKYGVAYDIHTNIISNASTNWYASNYVPKLFEYTIYHFNGVIITRTTKIISDYKDELNKLQKIYGNFIRFEIDSSHTISRIQQTSRTPIIVIKNE